MAAGIHEPTGNTAGRVTIWTTFASLIPPFAAIGVVVICALLEIFEKETAGAVVLGILATAGLTTGAVFTTAKKTPTDQARLIWGSQPVPDLVTPPPGSIDVQDHPKPDEPADEPLSPDEPTGPQDTPTTTVMVNRYEATTDSQEHDLAAEVEAVRARRSGSTAGGLA